jgi:hypothetical protein
MLSVLCSGEPERIRPFVYAHITAQLARDGSRRNPISTNLAALLILDFGMTTMGNGTCLTVMGQMT